MFWLAGFPVDTVYRIKPFTECSWLHTENECYWSFLELKKQRQETAYCKKNILRDFTLSAAPNIDPGLIYYIRSWNYYLHVFKVFPRISLAVKHACISI